MPSTGAPAHRRTGDVVGEELVERNCTVVTYPPPEHLVRDLGS